MRQVLLLCEYPTLNGGEQSMLATFAGLAAAGFSPAVIAPGTGPLAETLRCRGIECLPLECRDAAGYRRPLDALRAELAAVLTRVRPVLLHANSLSMARFSGPVAERLNLPSLGHLRDIVGLSAQAAADVNCHRRLLAVSEAVRAFHASGRLAAEKMHVLHNGVDLGTFQPRPPTGYLHAELGLRPSVPLVGSIGQISLRKGLDVLADALLRLGRRLGDAHWLIVGQRFSDKEESWQLADRLHQCELAAAGRVHFLGWRSDIARILNELSLLVHPARQEPLGRVLLEAAASGVAVVATDVGGTAEIFPPAAEAAVLVPADDPAAMAEAVGRLLADPPERQRLAIAARRRAEESLGIARSVTGLLRHYEAVLQAGAQE